MHHIQEQYSLIQKEAAILPLISSFVSLEKSRRSYKGNCPFHQDNSRSFMVNSDKNIFKCFGCGLEGGPVEFVMLTGKVNEHEAVKLIADHLDFDEKLNNLSMPLTA